MMDPKIQKAVEEKNSEYELMQKAKTEEEKINILDKMGLYTKEYISPKGRFGYSKEEAENYPFTEIVNGGVKRYRKVYQEVTDEEYETLKSAAQRIADNEVESGEVKINGYQNELAKFMLILSVVIYIAFFIIGIVMGNNTLESYLSSYSTFSFGAAMLYWVIGIIAGTMMLGFAHIVEHLYKQTLLLIKMNQK
ncbi:MAG: hypothetical protein IJ171_08685 [Ruminococcus sp.]|nr:hypothetical protein [Ruminococcus sp.]